MTPLEIQYEFKRKKKTQEALAEKLGVHPMSVSKVIHRKTVSDRIMRAIAEEIGMDHRAVFPDYYFGPKRRCTSKVEESDVRQAL